jgi:hypothetical protein
MTKVNEAVVRVVDSGDITDQDLFNAGIKLLSMVVSTGIIIYTIHFAGTHINSLMDSMSGDKNKRIEMKKGLAKRLNRPEVESMDFDNYEMKIMTDVIGCDEIDVSFADIGGFNCSKRAVQCELTF